MRFLWRHFPAAVAVVGCLSSGAAASPQQRFAEAQALFDAAQKQLAESGDMSVEARRQFYESATRFAALADEGIVSVNLYVNTANAYHFAGEDPRALLWYRRAARLANTPETRAGLATLRRLCQADLWPPEHASIGRALMFWHYDLSRRLKQMLLLATYPVGWALVIVSLFAKRRSLWRRLGITLIVIGGVIGVSDAVTAVVPPPRWAVVLEQVSGYAGDGEGYSVLVDSITAGQEVKVVESRPEWVQIELPSHTRCWIPAETCEKT